MIASKNVTTLDYFIQNIIQCLHDWIAKQYTLTFDNDLYVPYYAYLQEKLCWPLSANTEYSKGNAY